MGRIRKIFFAKMVYHDPPSKIRKIKGKITIKNNFFLLKRKKLLNIFFTK